MDSLTKKFITNITSRERPYEKGVFLIRLGKLLESGYSIKDALTFLEKIEKRTTKNWINNIQKGLLEGNTFHEELAKLGFPNKVCAQIYIASKFGNYSQTIIQCGKQLISELERKKKFQSLATYPFFLTVFLVGMLFLMRFVILPHMDTLFYSTGSANNLYSNLIVQWIYYSPQIIIMSLIFFSLLFMMLQAILRDKNFVERMQLFIKIPFLKNYVKDYWSHFFFREWGELLKNGCSFQEILQIMKNEDASTILQDTAEILYQQMLQGIPIHKALDTLPFFHEEGKIVAGHGENLGRLGTEMLVYASYCENEFNDRVTALMGKIQPVIFILVAVMIIAIYASLMLPIFTLMEGF